MRGIPMSYPLASSRRQHFRLWFEYLRLCHRLPDFREPLEKSAAFYEPWGDTTAQKFDDWWKLRRHIFGKTAVTVVDHIERHPNVLHLAVPLNVPISRTLTQVRGIVLHNQRKRLEQVGKNPFDVKTRSIGAGQFEPTPGVEIRGQTLYEILIILTAWIDLNRPAVNSDFCFEVLKRLKVRKRSTWVPYLLVSPPQKDRNGNLRFGEDQIRQIRRYLKRGMEVCRSVSLGEFPGKSRLV
jgi:hypothetical protein